jgi:hypothetical protein
MFVEICRWVLGGVLTGCFLLVVIANLRLVLHWFQQGNTSLIPIIGGVCGVFGFLLIPHSAFHVYWFLPLVVDPGSLPLVLLASVHWIKAWQEGR